MCGIVGFTNNIDNTDKVLGKMMDRIRHRGPDAEGRYIDDDIALGHRRLSIIDISSSGDQPIFNEDGSLVIVFNGEIYNYKEIREKLVEAGHRFKTNTDTEVLIHGYEEYGEKLLNMLRGMFSFVIWDKNKKELFGARDFFGIKPMYYAKMNSTLMFGSEIKSFLEHPEFVKELNTAALENYLTFQYSPTSETFFKNVYKLPPAHYFRFKDGKFEAKRYWDVKFNADGKPQLDEWVNRISDTFHNSVEAHKIADVEVGSFLSSGVDSSYVAAIADVDKTFTVGFGSDEKYNEIGWAKNFSAAIGKENTSKVITPEEYWNSLSMIQYHMDEPLADPSAVALYFVCNIASDKLKVVLSGEGADEIFGGYNVYSDPDGTLYDKLPRPIKREIGKIASKLPAHRGVNFFVRKGKDVEERFIGNAYMFTPADRKSLLKITTEAPDPTEITSHFYKNVKGKDDVTKMQYLDLHMWMAGDILLKADKMSMANSLELRVPFLDKEVMALAEKIPTKYRVTHDKGTDETKYITKYAMRLAAKKDTPEQTAKTAAKKKLGFPVPIRVWLKEDKYYELVKSYFEGESSQKFFNTAPLLKLLDDHRAGKADNSRKIWTVFIFLVWYKVYFENDGKY
ncbi:asparagine synthase (glutamine-hydrolyzing) [Ruminococcus flavefaciens]|uniref:asparagine synthase (glutamine-hydrolyzing) n=1 Tax=Ruminococcus flavefaciens TaxID=1265 RepID=A0A315Y4A3_RUMFL|nr:asparagine synthase (glutamine-hydrolyzing) [Ruminococcus flavefaciens]PWJ15195.1 asparagine synthase (glutamine-hydrolysing) [Ruminococcus flavefaciens]SSA40241.1 asparagine synthase (glutamine-hydrolysing) [Ruminococcus flavefaciens]